jgi:hypothetical protein
MAMRQNATSPSCFIMVLVKSASPTLTPPLVMMASACVRRPWLKAASSNAGSSRTTPQVDHLTAQARQQPEDRVAVAVVHRAFARRLAQAQDLVAGRKTGHLAAGETPARSRCPRLASRPQAAGDRRVPWDRAALPGHQVLAEQHAGCHRAAADSPAG